MSELIEKIKKYFGDRFEYTVGPYGVTAKIPGQFSTSDPVEKHRVDLLQADYFDKHGKLDEYLQSL